MQIQTHDISISNRLLWLINSQTFMLGIYVGTILFKSPDPHLHSMAILLNIIIAYLGFLTNLLTLIDISTSLVQIHKLIKNYRLNNNNQENEVNFPLIDGTHADRTLQRWSTVAVSIVFLVIWAFLILYDHQLIKI